MVEDFGVEAIKYNCEMIVLSAQLSDWGEASANQAIALTEYFINHYNIDKRKVYLHGYSGGGETGSFVMGMRPELYTAFLMTWNCQYYLTHFYRRNFKQPCSCVHSKVFA